MFQSFNAATSPQQGPGRLSALRARLASNGLTGCIVPRSDAHQGEYVAPCDERLAWLTGFTGSAGFCVVLPDIAAVFIDGRYRVAVKEQVDLAHFTPVAWPETKPAAWIKDHLPKGRIAYDPWLFTKQQIDDVKAGLAGTDITLEAAENQVDAIWSDRPSRPAAPVTPYPLELSGKSSADKRAAVADILKDAGQACAVLTLPDSICWLLNIRGSDIPRIPIAQCFAIVHDDARVDLFIDAARIAALDPDPHIAICPPDSLTEHLTRQIGPIRVDKTSAPQKITDELSAAGIEISYGDDPCILPKACKNPVEIDGARTAHTRDAVAVISFLAWLDAKEPGTFSEIDVVKALEGFRAQTNALKDISFETISGAGPNGAIVHYRVTEDTNRTVQDGELLLVDSGAQYIDGTTDITRTVAIGSPTAEQKRCFTRVLQGMIAVSRVRFPRGVTGRDIDPLARAPLWMEGMDYDHGTGHGVGAYLSVHEGPQRISRISEVALKPGMILSNEPGYYREGAFGIRIENLIVVQEAEDLGDNRDHLSFETLTWVPIDRHLIDPDLLSRDERAWIDGYHTTIREKIHVEGAVAEWLEKATAPL